MKSLLLKGLSFCPTTRSSPEDEVLRDLLLFERRCKLKTHFQQNPTGEEEEREFRISRGWTPLRVANSVQSFTTGTIKDIRHAKKKKVHDNLTKGEREALQKLMKDDTIVIKPADKGGAVVIQNKSDYIDECTRQLKNRDHYRRTGTDQTKDVASKVNSYIQLYKSQGKLDHKTCDYLMVKDPRTARFYTLPKIHKAGNPGRPIISANGCPTEKISKYVDHHINPLARLVNSYIKDTAHFLEVLKKIKSLPAHSKLVVIDVNALYTSILHMEGLAALREALSSRPNQKVPTEVIVKLAEIILQNNVFEFNGVFYKQIQGTAMGTKMAPSYAILYMDYLERKILERDPKPYIWLRFIDDIFMVWLHGDEELDAFLTYLNSFHETIKFTHESSDSTVNFLDVTVHKDENGELSTDVFVKPTDAHSYLNYHSCHPPHIVRSIPYSQALRVCRICSTTEYRDQRLADLKGFLLSREYPERLVTMSIEKALKDYESKERQQKKSPIPLILTFDPAFPDWTKLLASNLDLLGTDEPGQDLLREYKPMVTYRRPRSLRDILVNADVKTKKPQCIGCSTCTKHCATCNKIMCCKEVVGQHTHYKFKIRNQLNCQSKYILYMLQCRRCGIQYVGQTSNSLNTRVIAHMADIKKKKDTTVSKHYNSMGHSGSDLQAVALCRTSEDLNVRMRHEEAMILLLGTYPPGGLNVKQ